MKWSADIIFDTMLILYRGAIGDNAVHHHATLQIIIALEGELTVRDGGKVLHAAHAMYIRPGVPHQVLPAVNAFMALVEPQCGLAQSIIAGLPEGDIGILPEAMREAFIAVPSAAALASVIMPDAFPVSLDPRLVTALDLLSYASLADGVGWAARKAGLSESRLRAIAKQQLGVPLSKWLTWKALWRSVEAIRNGASLAAAAVDGGFVDQAHFSKTLKRTVGFAPSVLANAVHP